MKEINDLLNGKLTDEDEEDIEKEYNELLKLEEEEISKQLPEVPAIEPELPATGNLFNLKYQINIFDFIRRIVLHL